MVVACKIFGSVLVVSLVLGFSACSGPSCVRVSDCPQGQSCIASSCQVPGTGAGGSAAGAGTGAAGASGSISVAGTGGTGGQVDLDAGQTKDAAPGDGGP